MPQKLGRFPANDILSLTASSPRYDLAESVGPDMQLHDLVGEGIEDIRLGYGTAPGNAELREIIATMHNVGADDVVVTAGCMHALFLLAFQTCDAKSEVVTTSALFPNAKACFTAVGAIIRELPVSFETSYRTDRQALKALLSPATRLVCLASPQNPSGVSVLQVVLEGVLADMKEICPDAFLIVDETYRLAAYGSEVAAKSAVSLSDRVVVCASLSKCHGAPALRIGWAISKNAELRQQLVLGKFNTIIACSGLDEAMAIKVLTQDKSCMQDRAGHLAEGLAQIEAFMSRHSNLVDWVKPDAGALCCLRLKPGMFDDAAVKVFEAAMVSEDVRLANGSWFGDEARVFRIGFGLLTMPELEKALEALGRALQRVV
ncbi:MAG: pyridoxal phosphate-dependent aminotransferase [Cohaesibacteraceae bacterium]|nr:pyridoxal phosphate-dependent aminotransferase [Cohaesibacteraceae bacterium]MBL4876936.1 pyridoxal phosphate-dependent aminotransferase [Cohaesibacteraceae bacterium]